MNLLVFKQVKIKPGIIRLKILIDSCQFTGYLCALRFNSLGWILDELMTYWKWWYIGSEKDFTIHPLPEIILVWDIRATFLFSSKLCLYTGDYCKKNEFPHHSVWSFCELYRGLCFIGCIDSSTRCYIVWNRFEGNFLYSRVRYIS